jgi:Ca-activated chloride channel homolog
MTQTNAPVVLVTPIKPALIEGVAQKLAVLVRVQAPDAPPAAAAARKPYHLALVIDRSGSMSGEPLAQAVRCAAHVVDRLQPTDVAALVTFDDQIRVPVPAAPVGDRHALRGALAGIRSGGATNLYGGWKAGADALAGGAADAGVARVILLSDGNANAGDLQGDEEIAAACALGAAQGITTSTYGLGRDFNESLMVEMGKRGAGNHYYGETAADLFEPFAEEFDLISNLYARHLRLSLTAPAGVTLKLRNDYPIEERDGFPSIRLPDLPFAAEAWALIELEVPAGLALESGTQLLQAGVTGATPEGLPIVFQDVILTMKAVAPPAWNVLLADAKVAARVAEVEGAALLQAARAAAARGDWPAIQALLAEAQVKFAGHPWLLDVLAELADLAQARDAARFGKEALYSSRRMTGRLSAKAESLDLNADVAAPSYVRRKSAQGKTQFLRPGDPGSKPG